MRAMTRFKVCLIGATSVGKTSLVGQFVHSIFSDTYRTTIGVKIEAKSVPRGDDVVQLVIWDLSGEDEFQSVQPLYLSGSAGVMLVVDGTRRETVDVAITLVARVGDVLGDVPYVVAVNKTDLAASWEVEPAELEPLRRRAYDVVETSARTGFGVEKAFERLVSAIFARWGSDGSD
jgi:small GTP-binding protein